MAENLIVITSSLIVTMTAISPLPSGIYELFAQSTVSGKITLADRYGILAALMDESVSEEELDCINRLLHALRKGRLQVVDEISSVL